MLRSWRWRRAACVIKETTCLCVNWTIKHSQENICRVLRQNEKYEPRWCRRCHGNKASAWRWQWFWLAVVINSSHIQPECKVSPSTLNFIALLSKAGSIDWQYIGELMRDGFGPQSWYCGKMKMWTKWHFSWEFNNNNNNSSCGISPASVSAFRQEVHGLGLLLLPSCQYRPGTHLD